MEGSEEQCYSTETTVKQTCKFYMEGTCRFGDECWNMHPSGATPKGGTPKGGSPKGANKKSKAAEAKEDKKKRRMRTALDVIKRIDWDDNLAPELFKIGYEDRFIGIVEEPFTKFSHWGDLASVTPEEALAVPQHRIKFFKYKDMKVWDRDTRTDLIFGSTSNEPHDLEKVLNDIDQAIRQRQWDGPNYSDSEPESDSDDDLDVRINVAPADNFANINAEEERSTHFIAIRITNSNISTHACNIQRDVVRQDESLVDCCMKSQLFHITLSMMRIDGPEGIAETKDLMKNIKNNVEDIIRDHDEELEFKVQGLETFGQRVLYCKVEPSNPEMFNEIAMAVRKQIQRCEHIHTTNKFELVPHMTLVKVNRPTARARRSKYLPSKLYEDNLHDYLGQQGLEALHLCVIDEEVGCDGFYSTLETIDLRDYKAPAQDFCDA